MKLATLVRMEPHVESHKSWVKNWLLHSSFPLMCVLFIQIPAFFYFFLFSFFLSHSILKFLSFCCSIFFIFFFHLFISHSLSKFLSFSFLFSLFFSCFYTSLSIQIPVLLFFYFLLFPFFIFLSLTLYPNSSPLDFLFFSSFYFSFDPNSCFAFYFLYLSCYSSLHINFYLFLLFTSHLISFFYQWLHLVFYWCPCLVLPYFFPFFIYCVWNAVQIMHKKHGRADERPDSKFYSFYGKKIICF